MSWVACCESAVLPIAKNFWSLDNKTEGIRAQISQKSPTSVSCLLTMRCARTRVGMCWRSSAPVQIWWCSASAEDTVIFLYQ